MTAQLSLFADTPAAAQSNQPINFIAPHKPADNNTLAAAVDAFLYARSTGGKSKHTIKAYRADLRHFIAAIGADTLINAISEDDLNQFLQDRAQHTAPKTLERAITSLRSLFAWLTETNTLHHNPAAAIRYQPKLDTLPQLPTGPELDAILNAAGELNDPRPGTIVNLILHTGLKKGELMRLELGDISREAVLVKYTNPKLLWKARRLPLPQYIIPSLRRYREAYPATDATGRWFPFSEKTVENTIANTGYAAGLTFSLTAETLRWLYAVRQNHAGVNPDTIRENLGLSAIAWHLTWKKIRALSRLYPAG